MRQVGVAIVCLLLDTHILQCRIIVEQNLEVMVVERKRKLGKYDAKQMSESIDRSRVVLQGMNC